jgi:hypothetical protein
MATETTVASQDRREVVAGRWGALFAPPQVDISTVASYKHVFYPMKTASTNDRFYQFNLGDLGDRYLLMDTIELYIRGQLLKPDGKPIHVDPIDQNVCLVNYPLTALFNRATLEIGHNQLEINDSHYIYTSFIKSLGWLEEGFKMRESMGFRIDYDAEPGPDPLPEMWNDTCNNRNVVLQEHPNGVEFTGYVPLDLFSTESPLLPDVPLKLTLNRSDPDFYLITKKDNKDADYRFDIQDIYLKAVSVDTLDSIKKKVNHIMSTVEEFYTDEEKTVDGEPVKKARRVDPKKANYRYDSWLIRTMTVPQHAQYASFPSVFRGIIPRKILIAFISQEAMAGRKELNPFLFHHINVKNITVQRNSEPVEIIKADFSKGFALNVYISLLDWLGMRKKNSVVNFKKSTKGMTLFSYDALNDCSEAKTCNQELMKSGSISLVCELTEQLKKPYVMLVFGVRGSNLTLDRYNNAALSNTTI